MDRQIVALSGREAQGSVGEEEKGNYIFESLTGKGEPKMKVGDVVIAGRNAFRIAGVYLGAVGTQNLVGLESLNLATGYAHGGPIKEMFVPEELVLTAGVYRRVD